MQISPTATSIILSDKRLFPTFLHTIPSDNASIATITAVVREYAWQQVAIITERSPLFSNVCHQMIIMNVCHKQCYRYASSRAIAVLLFMLGP